LEPISIHLSYSSRISSFWAVVKCPRLEERDGTSKDITDFSPRQYCQITVTRQPDTEGVRSGLGAPPLFRRDCLARSVAGRLVDSRLPAFGVRCLLPAQMSRGGHGPTGGEKTGTAAEVPCALKSSPPRTPSAEGFSSVFSTVRGRDCLPMPVTWEDRHWRAHSTEPPTVTWLVFNPPMNGERTPPDPCGSRFRRSRRG